VGALSGFLLRNWTLKLAAFGVALMLWVAVRAETPSRQDFPGVPVQVDLSDPRWALAGEPSPSTVTVRFGGPSREILGIAVARPSVVIPIDAVSGSDTLVVLRTQWVQMQGGAAVIVESIEPAAVRLSLEPIESVTLPLVLRLEGELPQEFALAGPPILDPSGIRVSGPRSRLANLDSVLLQTLQLGSVEGSGRIALAIDTTGLSGVDTTPDSVGVEIRVEDEVERVVSGIPIVLPETLASEDDLELRPTTASVIVRGARSVVDRADPTLFRLVVRAELSDLPAAGAEREFPVSLSGLPALVRGEPQQAVVTVRRAN
jgi:YbbR domain-containing protein